MVLLSSRLGQEIDECQCLQVIRHAVSGMLPKNKLRQRRLDRLRIFPGEDMGPFKNNIVRRFEDGTLRNARVPPTTPLKPALVSHRRQQHADASS